MKILNAEAVLDLVFNNRELLAYARRNAWEPRTRVALNQNLARFAEEWLCRYCQGAVPGETYNCLHCGAPKVTAPNSEYVFK